MRSKGKPSWRTEAALGVPGCSHRGGTPWVLTQGQHSKGQQLLSPICYVSQGDSRDKGTVPDDGQVEAPLQTERRGNRHKRKGTKSQNATETTLQSTH